MDCDLFIFLVPLYVNFICRLAIGVKFHIFIKPICDFVVYYKF
jgi:hypothetical protein